MTVTANTTVTVYRGQSVDAFNDPIDIDAAVYSQQPASILEQSPNSRSRPVEGRTDQVRSYVLRPVRRLVLRKDDRVRDERTGAVYTIDILNTPTSPAGHNTTKAVMRKVT
jgi:hypothetical protein